MQHGRIRHYRWNARARLGQEALRPDPGRPQNDRRRSRPAGFANFLKTPPINLPGTRECAIFRARSVDRQGRPHAQNIAQRWEWWMQWVQDAEGLQLGAAVEELIGASQCFWPQHAPTIAVVKSGENPSFRARSAIWPGSWRSTSASAMRSVGRRARAARFTGSTMRTRFLSLCAWHSGSEQTVSQLLATDPANHLTRSQERLTIH